MADSYEFLKGHYDRIQSEQRSEIERERDTLLSDHGEALKFVREMSIQPCPPSCAHDCLACRTKAWLHEAGGK